MRILQITRRMVLAAAALALWPAAASAQGRLDAHYMVTLAGIPIGTGSWNIDIGENKFTASVNGKTSGLMHVLTRGEGMTTAHGTIKAGKVQSVHYVSSITSYKKKDEVRLSLNNGEVKDTKVDPPPDHERERVKITEADLQDVLDPMTASLLASPGTGDPLSPEACQRTLQIFDGRLRYDLTLAYKRMETVKAEKGYAGPAVVCGVTFTPIGGHIPSRATIRYLVKTRDMEVWLAPIAGTRLLVPFRAQGPTPIGEAVMVATEFVSAPAAGHGGANGKKGP